MIDVRDEGNRISREDLGKALRDYSVFDKPPYDYYDESLEKDLKGIVEQYNLSQYVLKKKDDDPSDDAVEIEALISHLSYFIENIFEKIFEMDTNAYDEPPINILKYLALILKLIKLRKDIYDAFIEEFDDLGIFDTISLRYHELDATRRKKRVERLNRRIKAVNAVKKPKVLRLQEDYIVPGFIKPDVLGYTKRAYEPMSIRRQIRQQIGSNDPYQRLIDEMNMATMA
jgi:hypothetical protein